MPQAVVVGTDATALHVGSQLQARGFEVTFLEATQAIGGQWIQRLFVDKAACTFRAFEDGVFLDFPFLASRQAIAQKKSDVSHVKETTAVLATSSTGLGKPAWTEQQNASAAPLPTEQQLLRHLSDYVLAAGLHRSVRLGCTLRRAKWQAMNGCWRLELKTESSMQRSQLSADLLVVSRMAGARPRLPRVPGADLYCGTILTVNDQLSKPGGEVFLEQQLAGRNVLVVGGAGSNAAAHWASTCRRHAGPTGSVVLLELEEGEEGGLGGGGRKLREDRSTGAGAGPITRLFASCFGGCTSAGAATTGIPAGTGWGSEAGGCKLDRFSPAVQPSPRATPPMKKLSTTGAPRIRKEEDVDEKVGGDGKLLVGVGDSLESTLEVEEGDGEGEADGVIVGAQEEKGGVVVVGGEDMDSGGLGVGHQVMGGREGAEQKHGQVCGVSPVTATVTAVADENPVPQEGVKNQRLDGGMLKSEDGGGAGGGAKPTSHLGGRSSLRVIRGMAALLNGAHVMLGSGEELPAEVVLLVPLKGTETSLAFLDAGGPLPRASQAGASSAAGSFKRANTHGSMNGSLAAATALATTFSEPLSRQMDELYRDLLSFNPAAPNFALVGAGPQATQHDARLAAVQAAWLVATLTGGGGGGGRGEGGGGGGLGVRGAQGLWLDECAAAGIGGVALWQPSPVEAAVDATLRARWRREAARRGAQDVYTHRYLQQLLADMGTQLQVPSKWLIQAALSSLALQLTRQKLTKLLGLKRLRVPSHPNHDDSLSGANGLNPSRRGYPPLGSPTPYGNSSAFASAAAAASACLASDRGSGPASRNASYSGAGAPYYHHSYLHHSPSGPVGALTRDRERYMLRGGGGATTGDGGGGVLQATRSEDSFGSSLLPPPPSASQPLMQMSYSQPAPSRGGAAGSALSFSRSPNNVILAGEQQYLFRVLEHPGEHLTAASADDTGIVAGGGDAPSDAGTAEAAAAAVQLPYRDAAPSSPISAYVPPGIAPLHSSFSNSIKISRSGGGSMAMGLPINSGVSAPFPGSGAGGFAAPSSPCSIPTAVAVGGILTSGGCGGYEPVEVSASGGSFSSSSQQRLRAQLLQRHRSTSRLAGVSNATSGPVSIPQQQASPAGAALSSPFGGLSLGGLSFGRRTGTVSTSQVNLDVGGHSFLNESRSQSGRTSNNRRGTPVSSGGSTHGSGGGGGGGGGGAAILGRVNSAARLQLLVAAANSASRRRHVTASQANTAPHSPEPLQSPVFSRGSSSYAVGQAPMQKVYIDALQALNPAATLVDTSYNQPSLQIDTSQKSGTMGTSVAALARAVRMGGVPYVQGGGALLGSSVSEPVKGDLETDGVPYGQAARGGGLIVRQDHNHGHYDDDRHHMGHHHHNAVYGSYTAGGAGGGNGGVHVVSGSGGFQHMLPLPADEEAEGAAAAAAAVDVMVEHRAAAAAGPAAAASSTTSRETQWGDEGLDGGDFPLPSGGGGGRRRAQRRSITAPDLRLSGSQQQESFMVRDGEVPFDDGA